MYGLNSLRFRPCSDGNGTERNRSRKWNAEGLRSDGTTSNRTVPFQSWTYSISDTKSGIGPFRSVPFPSEQTSGRMSKVRV